MAYGSVALGTEEGFGTDGSGVSVDAFDQRSMTGPAGLFCYGQVLGPDPDGLMELSRRELERVPEAVFRLGVVLAQKITRSVTVVARRDAVVRRLDPAFVLFVHDVAVDAGCGIVCEVGVTLRIPERVDSQADGNADCGCQDGKDEGRLRFGRWVRLMRHEEPTLITNHIKECDQSGSNARSEEEIC